MKAQRRAALAASANAGGALRPLELLHLANIDLSSHAPIRAAMAYVGSLVDELERAFAT